jgi:hypothetical protein
MSINRINRTKIQTAEETPFDNSNTDFLSEDVQSALVEIGASASPGVGFGRSGNNTSGTWLLVDGGVPSNRSGRIIFLSNPILKAIYVNTRNLATYTISVFEHDGDEINLSLIDTLSIVSSRGGFKLVDIPVTLGKQLAIQVTAGSGQDIVAGLILRGST